MRLVSEATACGLVAFSTEQGNRKSQLHCCCDLLSPHDGAVEAWSWPLPGRPQSRAPFRVRDGLGSSCWECRPGLSAPRGLPRLTSHAHFLRQLHLMTNLKGQSSLLGGKRCPLGLQGSENSPAAQPHLLPFSSRAVDPQGAPNRLPALQSSSPNLLPRDTVHLE